MPHIASIVCTPEHVEQRPPDHYARVPVTRALLLEGHGIQGDNKARGGKRQLNVLCAETVADLAAEGFHAAPGQLGEQLVIAGLADEALASGVRLHLGSSAVIEVAYPRTGCSRFAHIQGRPKEAAQGRLGVMARVVRGGEIAVGDEVPVAAGGGTEGTDTEARDEP